MLEYISNYTLLHRKQDGVSDTVVSDSLYQIQLRGLVKLDS